uniref:Geranylgeranyl transferase type I subunit beta n=1 Tax=Echinostoma caproni TaxID=27848 RepID=A0A183B7K8_9TREM
LSHFLVPSHSGYDAHCGFRGSSYVSRLADQKTNSPYDCGHVTMAYNALCILLTMGDDLSSVDRRGVLNGITSLQCKDEPGLFQASLISPERDMRFVYSAVASCFILDGLDVLDKDAIISFIDRSYVSFAYFVLPLSVCYRLYLFVYQTQ